MTPIREHIRSAAGARRTRVALLGATICLAVLALAPPAMAGPVEVTPPATPDRIGRTLFADNGEWLPTDNNYSYAWQRCNSAGTACLTVAGRAGPTYLLTTPDVGRRIRSVVTADNPLLGPSVGFSPATGTIAASPPVNSVPPSVTGSPEVGSGLSSALGSWTDPSPANVVYRRQWQRCAAASGISCQNIPDATGGSYMTGSADLGMFVRVLVSAEGLGTRFIGSPTLGPIVDRPGSGGDSGGGPGGSNPPAGGLRKLRPFPRVIVAGRHARGLTFISGLAIRRGPRGAMVAVRCRGRGCPRGTFRRRLGRRGSLKLRRYQRIYGPGTVIEIRITKRGFIGKFTRLRVRSRSVPSRRDACLRPGSSRPRRCPR